MTAREIFKSLGYAKKEKSESIAYYVNEYGDTISFKKTKYVVITPGDGGGTVFMNCLLENAIHKQCEELGWIESEQKQETNLEHYLEYLSKLNMSEFALIDGRVTRCLGTGCSECDFNGDCIEGKFRWLKQPYKEPTFKLSQFEYDLLNAYKNSGMRQCISNYGTLLELYKKGYFKDIGTSIPIHEIIENCEVIE